MNNGKFEHFHIRKMKESFTQNQNLKHSYINIPFTFYPLSYILYSKLNPEPQAQVQAQEK